MDFTQRRKKGCLFNVYQEQIFMSQAMIFWIYFCAVQSFFLSGAIRKMKIHQQREGNVLSAILSLRLLST